MGEASIEGAEIAPLRFTLKPPLMTSRRTVAVRETLILRLFDRDGVVGAGEAAPAYWLGGETLGQTRASLRKLAARLAAQAITPAELRRWAGLNEAFEPAPGARQGGESQAPAARRGAGAADADRPHGTGAAALSPAARSALDCALLELRAKRAGRSVAELLAQAVGGAEPARPVRVAALLTADSTLALAAQARAAARAGFRTLKLKIGAGANDLERARAVAEAAGPGAALRLDANRAFDFERALELLSALAGAAPIEFVEEPLARPSPAQLKRLRALSGVRVALDESFAGRASLEPYLGAGAADVIVLKAARLGGLSRCAELAALAARAGLAPCVTDSIESALGMSAAVHLAAALPNPTLAVGLGGARYISARALAPFPGFSPSLRAAGAGFAVCARSR